MTNTSSHRSALDSEKIDPKTLDAIEIRILTALDAFQNPVTVVAIAKVGCIPESYDLLNEILHKLWVRGLLLRYGDSLWSISSAGTELLHLIAAEAKRDSAEKTPTAPAAPVNEETDPPTALLCVDEDELDAWWQSLDVEQKADAFVRFTLTMYQDDSHIYIDDAVPVLGTVGDNPGNNAQEARS